MVTPFMSEVLEREEKIRQLTYVFATPPPKKNMGIHPENLVYNSKF